MKTKRAQRYLVLVCMLVLVVTGLGCETVKGLGRDVKNADQWFRDHAW
ncbi:MAG: hypothetical protein WC732_07540 [Candidatus Omnitrophota bacterium]